tara:strand:+ start:1773 stop:3716 length:1944 start_codon:yes stop_codon:yes gene_type:complete
MRDYEAFSSAASQGLKPDLDLTVDEWSDRFMIIPKSSGSNEYGPYRTDRTPHARQIMRALSDNHPCKKVVAKVASQMFKTQVAMNWLACSIHQSPANFLLLMPTGKLHKRIAARIDKIVAAVPEIKSLVAKPNSRDAQNNLDTKEYKGGALFLATAGAAANLSEVPARRVAFDEVDRAVGNVDGEGDPIKLGEARQTTFQSNRKGYYYSSPTIEGESRIHELFEQGTQRKALAECIHCGHELDLQFENLVTLDDGAVVYPCDKCGGMHQEADKTAMFKRGLWSDSIGSDGETESFTASAMFLPYGWLSWRDLTLEYNAAKQDLDDGAEETMIVFYNTRLAKCWERKKEQAKHNSLMARAQPYDLMTVPYGAFILTAAVDTQDDRLEMKVIAWGEGMECYVVNYKVVLGSPADDETWEALEYYLKQEYKHTSGNMLRVSAAFIDSGGHYTQEVYNFTRRRKRRKIFAIKGSSSPGKPILGRCSKVDVNHNGRLEKKGVSLWMIGTDTAKDYLLNRWDKADGPGAVHFSHELEEDYYKQLTSEYRTTRIYRGRKIPAWEKKARDRNEALDLMVYNLAASHYLGLHKLNERQWATKRDKILKIKEVAVEVKEEKQQETEETKPEVIERQQRKRIKNKRLRGRFNPNSLFT